MATRCRVTGHAGLWAHEGPAVVVGDSETFEHDLVLVSQIADPGHVIVVGPEELVVYDTPAVPVAV